MLINNKRKPSDLEPAYIVEAVQQLNSRLAVIIEDESKINGLVSDNVINAIKVMLYVSRTHLSS